MAKGARRRRLGLLWCSGSFCPLDQGQCNAWAGRGLLFPNGIRLPDNVDAGEIDPKFKKGFLLVPRPKRPEAVKETKKIAVKAA